MTTEPTRGQEPPKLSPDQQVAFDTLLREMLAPNSISTLAGAAGCGKTTLTRMLIQALEDAGLSVTLGATTGRAALRLQDVTSRAARTVHSLLYGDPKHIKGRPVFENAKAPCPAGGALIIDEASMMGKALYDDLVSALPPGARVLFVGDHEQLAPVNDEWGPDLQNPTALLTQVHRQALNSPIISYATAIREGWLEKWEADYARAAPRDDLLALDGEDAAIEWYLNKHKAGEDSIIVTFTHKTRKAVNAAIRATYGFTDPFSIYKHDRLVIKTNNKHSGLRNGEVVDVAEVLGDRKDVQGMYVFDLRLTNGHAITVPQPLIGCKGDDWWRWRSYVRKEQFVDYHHVQFGHCLTTHSCQGSQYDNVVFLEDDAFDRLMARDPAGAKRLRYTAVTRAVKRLRVAFI